jgi:hypothetical protein
MQNSAPTGICSRTCTPGRKLVPTPVVHADLAPHTALAVNEDQTTVAVKVALGESECLVDAQPGAPQHDDQGTQTAPQAPSPAARITPMISSTGGGSAGYANPCCGAADRRGSRERPRVTGGARDSRARRSPWAYRPAPERAAYLAPEALAFAQVRKRWQGPAFGDLRVSRRTRGLRLFAAVNWLAVWVPVVEFRRRRSPRRGCRGRLAGI